MKDLTFPLPDIIIQESCLSTSGKYKLYLGQHYEKGIPCWVVGAISGISKIKTERHYNEKIEGCYAPKALAQHTWEEFKNSMTERVDYESEEEEFANEIRPYLQLPKLPKAGGPSGKPN